MSARGLAAGHGAEDLSLDIEAVVDRLQLDQFIMRVSTAFAVRRKPDLSLRPFFEPAGRNLR